MTRYSVAAAVCALLLMPATSEEQPAIDETDLVEALQKGSLTGLTDDPGVDIEPKWSPDGSTLSFASNRTGDWDDIWLLRAE